LFVFNAVFLYGDYGFAMRLKSSVW